jgi:cytochrome b pre-mRNA-processing protein 3
VNLLSRLFGTTDSRAALRPLWHRTVAISREPEWYEACGAADSVPGRFDMVTAVLSLVLLRLEQAGHGAETALLTELFVEDMDGQLRESGVGDVVVGKHIGRLMATLGGRLGAYRAALAEEGGGTLTDAVRRNVMLAEDAAPELLAARLRELAAALARTGADDLLAGRIER